MPAAAVSIAALPAVPPRLPEGLAVAAFLPIGSMPRAFCRLDGLGWRRIERPPVIAFQRLGSVAGRGAIRRVLDARLVVLELARRFVVEVMMRPYPPLLRAMTGWSRSAPAARGPRSRRSPHRRAAGSAVDRRPRRR